MNKKVFIVIFGVLALLAVGVVAYVLRPTAEATAPIEAVELVVTEAPTQAPAPTKPNTAAPAVEEPTEAPTEEAPAGLTIFTISQAESQVSFSINEELLGQPTTAVGITNQVAGQIGVDLEAPANSVLGVITINARTIETDQPNRNRAIRNQILSTNQFEFITFTPTRIEGLPESITVGEPVTFLVHGDLNIRDISVPQTFQVTATLESESRLSGYGVSTVLRSDYQLLIPNVPSVANVSDEVLLEISFVALTD